MQEGIPNGEEASAWLREHFRDDPAPHVSITWTEDDSRTEAYGQLLEFLFAPRPGDAAA